MAERITLTFGAYSRSLDVPDGVTSTIHDAFASAYGYKAMIDDVDNPGTEIANPESKEAFTFKRIRLYVEDVLGGYNNKAAVATALATSKATNEAVLTAVVIDPV